MPAALAKAILASQRAKSIAWLSREIGISRSGLSRRLDGKLKWKPGEAETAARLLGVPVEAVTGVPADLEEACA